MCDIEPGIAIGEMGRKIMVVVDSKVKEIRASFCSLLLCLCLKHLSVYTDTKKPHSFWGRRGEYKKNY